MAVKQVRVSDLSGQQAGEEQFAKLIIHEHPQYRLFVMKRGARCC